MDCEQYFDKTLTALGEGDDPAPRVGFGRPAGDVALAFETVDALNFYYGAVKGTPNKWVDFEALAVALAPRQAPVSIS